METPFPSEAMKFLLRENFTVFFLELNQLKFFEDNY